jgi:uncharacterized protein YkwD
LTQLISLFVFDFTPSTLATVLGAMEKKMNKYISVLALLALPACLGGDSGTSISGPTASQLNTELGGYLNSFRMTNGESTLDYEPQLAAAAQVHADDLFDNDSAPSIFLTGTATDIGDTLNSMGYSWNDIDQFIAEGDFTVQSVFTEWQTNGSQGNGSDADDLIFADHDEFGFAKAGTGADQRWVLVLTNIN